ncbi:ATP synthase subunit I [Marinospirillum alkaliphilum]|uniref:ATP synthase protein I n=1 Tax=Marinospirillum alkaliphilum DSM 21637 TaxID=1122209 RepID=A0A1K1WTD3_9GAMM|nr:ATP synthase subunit I [Marinospirillum alkaliphilum]SFX40045.1 ATP synthase protein I [Marinospirillum alkaliphilum DSM 21637]
MADLPLPPYKKLLLLQLLTALVLALLLEVSWKGSGLSALWGGMIALLPQAVFAYVMFRHRGARRIGKAVQQMFMAELLKFGLTVVLFVLVFVAVQPSNPISLLIAYSVVLMAHWLAPWLMQSRR